MSVEVWRVVATVLAGVALGGVATMKAKSGWIVATIAAVLLVVHVWGWA